MIRIDGGKNGATVTIMNAAGIKVHESTTTGEHHVDVRTWSRGLYLVCLEGRTEKVILE
jgi:hypothetical protein